MDNKKKKLVEPILSDDEFNQPFEEYSRPSDYEPTEEYKEEEENENEIEKEKEESNIKNQDALVEIVNDLKDILDQNQPNRGIIQVEVSSIQQIIKKCEELVKTTQSNQFINSCFIINTNKTTTTTTTTTSKSSSGSSGSSGSSSSKPSKPSSVNRLFYGLNFMINDCTEEEKDINIEIKNIITNGKGKIFDKMNTFYDIKKKVIPGTNIPNRILLSSTFSTSVQYIRGIVEKVLCLSTKWIKDSNQDNQLKPYEDYILPLGALISGKVVYRTPNFKFSKILEDFRIDISLTSTHKSSYKNDWSAIISKCGGKVVDRIFTTYAQKKKTDAYLNENNIEKHTTTAISKEQNVPVITDIWIIQSILSNERLDHRSHESFTVKETDNNNNNNITTNK